MSETFPEKREVLSVEPTQIEIDQAAEWLAISPDATNEDWNTAWAAKVQYYQTHSQTDAIDAGAPASFVKVMATKGIKV